MCIFSFGRVPKETRKVFLDSCLRPFLKVRSGKKASGKRFSCEDDDKEPILGIFFFSFVCNEPKNLQLLIYS